MADFVEILITLVGAGALVIIMLEVQNALHNRFWRRYNARAWRGRRHRRYAVK